MTLEQPQEEEDMNKTSLSLRITDPLPVLK